MPDKWEYPWFAAWDTAFHMIPFAAVDPDFAKHQLLLLLREWYMHPNGQLPAYEWNFSDVNPPVHAWAVWRVYKIADAKGNRDLLFLERAFQKLLLNFTWWVNRKDVEGRHVFGGGFLGLDNIGVFDRSHALPGGGHLNQADGTAWMASFCLIMLSMSLELALEKPAYEDIASKFFEHFVNICDAINSLGGTGLWDDEDGFYYDQLIINHERAHPAAHPLARRSAADVRRHRAQTENHRRAAGFPQTHGLVPRQPPGPAQIRHRPPREGRQKPRPLPARHSVRRTPPPVPRLHARSQGISIRSSASARSARPTGRNPSSSSTHGQRHEVPYTPGEATTDMFGGNSNWRGPIWFPINFLIIEALERYHYFYGDSFKIEYPTGSGKLDTLREIAIDLCDRLISLFLPDKRRLPPLLRRRHAATADSPDWQNLLLFHEYFHAETGEGLGASHQTGWTSLVVRLVRERREKLTHALCNIPNPTATPIK